MLTLLCTHAYITHRSTETCFQCCCF